MAEIKSTYDDYIDMWCDKEPNSPYRSSQRQSSDVGGGEDNIWQSGRCVHNLTKER